MRMRKGVSLPRVRPRARDSQSRLPPPVLLRAILLIRRRSFLINHLRKERRLRMAYSMSDKLSALRQQVKLTEYLL